MIIFDDYDNKKVIIMINNNMFLFSLTVQRKSNVNQKCGKLAFVLFTVYSGFTFFLFLLHCAFYSLNYLFLFNHLIISIKLFFIYKNGLKCH